MLRGAERHKKRAWRANLGFFCMVLRLNRAKNKDNRSSKNEKISTSARLKTKKTNTSATEKEKIF